jgi:hypothetical protein
VVIESGSFRIELLAKGQPLPAGTVEATLTLSDDERTIEVAIQPDSMPRWIAQAGGQAQRQEAVLY